MENIVMRHFILFKSTYNLFYAINPLKAIVNKKNHNCFYLYKINILN